MAERATRQNTTSSLRVFGKNAGYAAKNLGCNHKENEDLNCAERCISQILKNNEKNEQYEVGCKHKYFGTFSSQKFER